MTATDTYTFRAALRPALFRVIEIAGNSSLYRLAEVIVWSFEFDFDHAFGFYSRLTGNILDSPKKYELFTDMGEPTQGAHGVKKTRIDEVFGKPGAKMTLLFDYGDEWLFRVKLVSIKPKQGKVKLPRQILAMGKAPPQYPDLDEE